jgi:membrane-associated phospholipid phosphatase
MLLNDVPLVVPRGCGTDSWFFKEQQTMNACWFLALVGAMSLTGAHTRGNEGPGHTRRNEVIAWNAFAADLVARHLAPGPQTHTLAIVQIAVHDALNAINPRYEPYAFVTLTPHASVAAAVAAAARDSLVELVPQAATSINAEYDLVVSAIPDGEGKDVGIATGQSAAAAILDLRRADDLPSAITKPYLPGPPLPGVYQPTPPLNFVILAGWREISTFALKRAGQFHTPAPPPVKSFKYAYDYHEAKSVGSASSTVRTADQTDTALFWYNVATKEWNLAAHAGLADVSADEWRAARTLAVLNISLADAVIATFETKFRENFWRPITAIRAGGADDNPATEGDSTWEPLCITPPFSEYSSTHAATAAAAAGALALELGDRLSFIVTNPSGASRTYARFSTAAAEEGISRIYCGIHFRSAMNSGFMQGALIARYVHKTLLRPLGD